MAAQGGDVSFIDRPEKLPSAMYETTIKSPANGWVSTLNARLIGETAVLLGAGRAKKGDPIDLAVGILVEAKVGDPVKEGQPIFTILANSKERFFTSSAYMPPSAAKFISSKNIPHIVGWIEGPGLSAYTVITSEVWAEQIIPDIENSNK